MSHASKPFQPEARMIREGITETFGHPVQGPLLRQAILDGLGLIAGGGGLVSLAAVKAAMVADTSPDTRDIFVVMLNRVLTEVGAEPLDHLIVRRPSAAGGEEFPMPLQRDPAEDLGVVLGEMLFGRWSVDLPAAAFIAPSGGPSYAAVTATTPPFEAYQLPDSGTPTLYCHLTPPRSMNRAPFRVQMRSTHATSATSGITWQVAAALIRPGETVGSATFGSEVTINHTCVAGAYAVQQTTESALITPGGTWSDGCMLVLRVRRNTAAAGDTLAQTVLLLGATAHFERAAFTDAAGAAAVVVTPAPPTGIVVTSATITPPASRLVGQAYTAVVDANGTGYTIQWTRDGVDVPGAVGTTYAPADPGRIGFRVIDSDGTTTLATAATVWARQIKIENSAASLSLTGFSIGANYPNKKLYLYVEGTRASGSTEFHLTVNGATSGLRVGATIWTGTAFAQVYAIDNPGTTIDVAPGDTGASLSNLLLGFFSAAGFEHATATDHDIAAQLTANNTSSSITNTNAALGLILTMGRGYPQITAPASYPILYADAANHFTGGNPPAANTDRTFTAARPAGGATAANKIFGVVSFAPLADV